MWTCCLCVILLLSIEDLAVILVEQMATAYFIKSQQSCLGSSSEKQFSVDDPFIWGIVFHVEDCSNYLNTKVSGWRQCVIFEPLASSVYVIWSHLAIQALDLLIYLHEIDLSNFLSIMIARSTVFASLQKLWMQLFLHRWRPYLDGIFWDLSFIYPFKHNFCKILAYFCAPVAPCNSSALNISCIH